MDTRKPESERPPKPWAPQGWKVHWSKRKAQWYWASPAKKTYWTLPPEMCEPAELPAEEEEPLLKPKKTRSSKKSEVKKQVEALNEPEPKPKKRHHKSSDFVEVSPAKATKPESLPEERNEEPKPLDNQDISRVLSSLSSLSNLPGLGVAPSLPDTSLDDDLVQAAPVIPGLGGAAAPVTTEADLAALLPAESTPDVVPTEPEPIARSLESPLPDQRGRDSGHGDAYLRGQHYSQVARDLGSRTKGEREDTPSFRMCKHNNWLKSILLESTAVVFGEGARINVMDLACGRGGDLHKWRKVAQKFRQHIDLFYGIDNASGAIDHCRNVRAKQLPSSTHAHWLVEDLEKLDLFERLASTGTLRPGSIQIASMQFALHYFFRSEAALSAVFRLASNALAEGGLFACTYADGNAIVRLAREKRWKRAVDAAKSGEPYYEPPSVIVSNDLFQIDMPVSVLDALQVSPDPFGHAYRFTLENAVRGQREYLVVDDVLTKVAEAFGFRSLLEENFQPLTHDMMRVGSHQELMRIMKVFGKEPELHQAEWDAIGLYKARIFVKDSSGMYEPKAREWIRRYLF